MQLLVSRRSKARSLHLQKTHESDNGTTRRKHKRHVYSMSTQRKQPGHVHSRETHKEKHWATLTEEFGNVSATRDKHSTFHTFRTFLLSTSRCSAWSFSLPNSQARLRSRSTSSATVTASHFIQRQLLSAQTHRSHLSAFLVHVEDSFFRLFTLKLLIMARNSPFLHVFTIDLLTCHLIAAGANGPSSSSSSSFLAPVFFHAANSPISVFGTSIVLCTSSTLSSSNTNSCRLHLAHGRLHKPNTISSTWFDPPYHNPPHPSCAASVLTGVSPSPPNSPTSAFPHPFFLYHLPHSCPSAERHQKLASDCVDTPWNNSFGTVLHTLTPLPLRQRKATDQIANLRLLYADPFSPEVCVNGIKLLILTAYTPAQNGAVRNDTPDNDNDRNSQGCAWPSTRPEI